jgi:hypothetical protein
VTPTCKMSRGDSASLGCRGAAAAAWACQDPGTPCEPLPKTPRQMPTGTGWPLLRIGRCCLCRRKTAGSHS